MLKGERIRRIKELLEQKGSVQVKDLSDHFNVTMMTIRRDLDEIERMNNIIRTHGGAIYKFPHSQPGEMPTQDRMRLMSEEKIRIAKKTAELINKGEMIFLGSGTTTTYVAREIAHRDDITVVTNSLSILNELAATSTMALIGIGGYLRRSEYSMIGHVANDMIKDLHVDKVIMGMRGIHPRFGLTSDQPEELMTDRLLLGIGDSVIIVADHTKIGHVAPSRTAYLDSANIIITAKVASPVIIDSIKGLGITVFLV